MSRWAQGALHGYAFHKEALADWGIGGKTHAGYGRIGEPRPVVTNRAQPEPGPTRQERSKGRPRPVERRERLQPEGLRTGQEVQCVVIEEKTARGGWKFKVKDSDTIGILHPQSPVPPEIATGMEFTMNVKTPGKTPQFHWENPSAKS